MDDNKLIEAVANAVADDRRIDLSTGVVLKGRQVNPLVLTRLMGSHPKPKVPKVFIQNMGREMENPDDPDYIEAVKMWRVENSDALARAMILLGTTLVSIPDGIPGPDDQAWQVEYRLLGLETQDNPQWRYLNWVQFKAVASEGDVRRITQVVGRLSGVSEADVKSVEAFPGSNPAAG